MPQLLTKRTLDEVKRARTPTTHTKEMTMVDNFVENAHIRDHDVLLGRGGRTNLHVGNKRFRSVVNERQTEYLEARKCDKVLIARLIVTTIKSNGGRFLKQSDCGNRWVEVTEKRAQQKTSQALREGLNDRRTKKKQSTIQQKPTIVTPDEKRTPEYTLGGYYSIPGLLIPEYSARLPFFTFQELMDVTSKYEI